MSLGANVRSIEALKSLRAAIIKFISEADKAMQEADAEADRVADWISHDRPAHWRAQLKKRDNEVAKAKDDLRRVQLTIADRPPSAVEQKKALKRAQARYEEARQKIQLTREWRSRFEQEMNEYRGQTGALGGAIESSLPKSLALLDTMLMNLEEYISVRAPDQSDEMAQEIEKAASSMAMTAPRKTTSRELLDLQARGESLRARVLDDESREVVPHVRDLDGESAADSVISVLDDLDVTPEPPRPGDLVVLEGNLQWDGEVFLARTPTEQRGDSGWYIGRADGPEAGGGDRSPIAVTSSRFLLAYPEFREVLTLPVGYVVILSSGQVHAIFDPENAIAYRSEEQSVK